MSHSVSRREFMNLLSATFGTGALIQLGSALSLLPMTAKAASLSLAAPMPGKGKVVILGAGISGLNWCGSSFCSTSRARSRRNA